jgi:PucR C-terminal helix-turn-helix domain
VTTSEERPWSALPARLRDALRPGLPALADEIIAEIAVAVPEYDRPLRGGFGRGIRTGVEQALSEFVDLLGRPGAAPRGGVYRALGRGEHREGRSLDALQAAYRTGARVAWRRSGEAAAAAGISADDQRRLAEAIFAYIDQLAAESVAGYAAAQARVAGEAERRRRQLIAALIEGQPQPAVEAAAADAGWALPRTLAVVVTDAAERAAARLGPDAIAADDILVVADPEAPGSRLRAVLATIVAGVGPAVEPAQAPLSHRLAAGARRLADGGPVHADERLPDLLVSADEQLAERLAVRALAPLEGDRSGRLTETLRAWLDAQGHHPTVAAALHIHPQTVRYRLARLRERFGDALDDPEQRLALQLALRARGCIKVGGGWNSRLPTST